MEVPRKCSRCRFLFHDSIYGLTCRKDAEKWGGCYRGLDWGAWRPDRVYFDLPHLKVSSQALMDHAHSNDLGQFVLEHRRLNPDLSLAEARADFARLRQLIDQPPMT